VAVAPIKGPAGGGQTVTLTGTNFSTSGTAQVWFGPTPATNVSVVNSTTCTCLSPAGPALQTVHVAMANADGGSATLPGAYTFAGAPWVTAISPGLGLTAGGDTVTITGQGFDVNATAALGGAALAISSTTATQIIGTTGARGVGVVDVVVTNPDTNWDRIAGGFIYTTTPTLTSVSPPQALFSGGTTITITGADFVAGATVDLEGTPCTSVVVVSANEIRCTVPALSPAELDLTVTNPGGYSATLTDVLYVIYPNSHQRAQYTFDTSAGIDRTRRWLIETNWAAFRTDLGAKGLQSGTASDPVNEYAVDWMSAYICMGVNIHYGRNGDGSKNSGTSINVTFVVATPATGTPGGTGTGDYSRMCVGGISSSGSGVLGTAWLDTGTPCGNSTEDDCLGPQFGGSGSTLGVFTQSVSASGGSLSPALSQADQKYLDGSVNSGARYTAIHTFMQQWSWRICSVASHEIGHSLGLNGSALTGSCTSASQCSAPGAHNNCCTTNIMRSAVSYSGLTGYTSRAFSGQPGSVSVGTGCFTGALSSWAMLSSWLGLSP